MFFGTEDKLVNVAAAEAFYEQLAVPDKTLFKVEGSRHETLHDKDRATVTDRIAEWINKRAVTK